MPTATLTWSENHGDSNPQSTFAATTQGGIQLLNQYFTALAAFSDFPWQVASFEGTTSPWQITLKRKSAAAGRIIFVGVTSAPSETYNPQLGTISWSSAGMRAAWFPEATSDTPANILATSGDVFTNPGNATGMAANYSSFNTGAHTFTAWACEDGIVMRHGATTGAQANWAVGNLIESAAGDAAGISFFGAGTFDAITSVAYPSIAQSGGFSLVSGVAKHFGNGWTFQSAPNTLLRDNGLKKSWYLPRSLSSISLPPADLFSYKFRQITHGPTPLAAYERLASTGDVLQAQYVFPGTTAGHPWLTNFKV